MPGPPTCAAPAPASTSSSKSKPKPSKTRSAKVLSVPIPPPKTPAPRDPSPSAVPKPTTRSQTHATAATPRPLSRASSPSLNASSSPSLDSSIGSVSSIASQPRASTYRYVLRNIPDAIKTQKALFNQLKPLRFPLKNLKLNHNRTALLETSAQLAHDSQKALQHLLGDPHVTLSLLNSRSNPQPSKSPSFSCVIRNIDLDITPEEVINAIALPSVTKALRITSRATSQPTSFMRLITSSKTALDFLLARGVFMFGRHYPAEPSHIPAPVPKYCSVCTRLGHQPSDCPTRKPVCPNCGEPHRAPECKSSAPRCNNCQGPHPTFSFQCPQRRIPPATVEEAAPLRLVETSTSTTSSAAADDTVERFLRIDQFIKVLTVSLLSALPNERKVIARAMDNISQFYFDRGVRCNFSGNTVAITCFRLSPD